MQHTPHPARQKGLPEYIRTYFRSWWTPAEGRGAGEPAPLSPEDMRTWPTVIGQVPYGMAEHTPYRMYSPGAQAQGYRSGILQLNPIGAGVVFTKKLPIFPSRVGTYMAGGIYWSAPYSGSTGPQPGPLYTPSQLAILITQPGPAPETFNPPSGGSF